MEKRNGTIDEGMEKAVNEEIMQDKIDKALALLDEWRRYLELKYEIE